MQTIDYKNYSLEELYQALNSIDKERFPDNYQAIVDTIQQRRDAGDTLSSALRELPYFAGFWRRVFAHLVDCIFLTLALLLVGFLFFDSFAALGQYGIILGFAVSAIYFTLGYSGWFDGQTPGKSMVDIRVVDKQGQSLSLGRAFTRYLILDFPFYVSGMLLLWSRPDSFFDLLVHLSAISVVIISLYLLIFNRPSRRTLHDYIAGSLVINLHTDIQSHKPLWKGHYAFLIPIILLLAFFNIGSFQKNRDMLTALSDIKDTVESNSEYFVTGLSVREFSTPAMKGKQIKTLVLTVHTYDTQTELDTMSDKVTQLLKDHPDLEPYHNMYLLVTRGYNLGIAYSRQQEASIIQL